MRRVVGVAKVSLRGDLAPQIVDRRLGATGSMRDSERLQSHLHRAQRAKHHRRIGVSHVGDAESTVLERASPTPSTTPHLSRV